jgi:cytochrome P450/NADPH-cytochrome P450 reductase
MPTKIPYPERKFIQGNLHQLNGGKIMDRLIEVTKDFRPILELKVLNIVLYVINDVDLAKEVYDEKYYDKFIDKPVEHLRAVAGDGLFTAYTDEENWSKAHRILSPAFGHGAVANYVPLMNENVQKLVDRWTKNGTNVDVCEDMTRLTFEVIGICGFDYSFGCFENEEQHPFVKAMLFAIEECVWRARTAPFLLPFRFKKNKLFKQYVDYMNDLLDSIIKKRRLNPEEYSDKIDLLNLMLQSKDSATGTGLSDENIRHQIVTFMVAGHETTSALLSFALYCLAENKEVLQRAYTEVDHFFEQDPNRTINHSDFMQFEYLRQILMETLRLYPPLSLFTRYAKEDTHIGAEQYPIKANTAILMMVYNLHRDPKHWGPNPEKFDPEHFSKQAFRKRDRDAFKSFGHGLRSCIGQHFALLESVITLAKILQNFEFSFAQPYTLSYSDSVTLRPDQLRLNFVPRTKQ